jgi:hypothetical protein
MSERTNDVTQSRRRGSDDPPRADEVEAFRAIKWWRQTVWLISLTFLPGAGLAGAINERLGLVVGLAWMAAFGLAGAIHSGSRCPRCGRFCFLTNHWHNSWARRCLHCRTKLYWSTMELTRAATSNLDEISHR